MKELWKLIENDLYDHEKEGEYIFDLIKCEVIKPIESPMTFKSGSQSFRINLKKVETLHDSDEEEQLTTLTINKKFTE